MFHVQIIILARFPEIGQKKFMIYIIPSLNNSFQIFKFLFRDLSVFLQSIAKLIERGLIYFLYL